MNVQEFVSQAINDKNFLLEACKHIPEEYLNKSDEGEKQGEESNPDIMGDLFFPAAQAMGVETTRDEVNAQFESQIKQLGGFAKRSVCLRQWVR